MKITIRQGTPEDLPAAYRLVGELAHHLDATHDFTASLENFHADFDAGFFHFVVAEDTEADRVVGLGLYNFVYSTWKGRMIYLEDLVMDPAYRGQGIGQRLWDTIKARGRERDCQLLKWQVIEDDDKALRFYSRQEATFEEHWFTGKIEL